MEYFIGIKYKFEELSQEAKKKVFNKYQSIIYNHIDDEIECLKENYIYRYSDLFKIDEILIDASFSQGSGSSFTGAADLKGFIKKGILKDTFINRVINGHFDFYLERKSIYFNYCHENTVEVVSYCPENRCFSKELDDYIDNLIHDINIFREQICIEIQKEAEDISLKYYGLNDDTEEILKEYFEALEIFFDKKGNEII